MGQFIGYWIAALKLTKAQVFALFYRFVRWTSWSYKTEWGEREWEDESKIPDQLSCDECSTEEHRIIHWAVGSDLEDGQDPNALGPWVWEILNHDKTCRFEWPIKFDTKDDAWAHIHGILTAAAKEVEEEKGIVLNEKEAERFTEALANPPEPCEALKEAAKKYQGDDVV